MVKNDTNIETKPDFNNKKPFNEKKKNINDKNIKNESNLTRTERRKERNTVYLNQNNPSKKNFHKLNNDQILEKFNFNFSRDAEWYKKTNDKINEVKDDLDKKFYSPQKKAEKIDFINKLKNKLKDYRDAINFAEKYKKVRFVERRKLERMFTKVNKEIIEKENLIKLELEKNPNINNIEMTIALNDLIVKKEKNVADINYVKVDKIKFNVF